ncbi:hypothetical protein LDJ79_17180 [Vibrio tritonius]|uniref:Transposase n=1 Tax=Vibrio tritonius TaxID=1435069 RepID=A0ABS7YSA5_9VIBR|nr:hypothetical protein [Vibrio tritonius]MCA2017857.1 hypothetical protein [Vibrio tritonius]
MLWETMERVNRLRQKAMSNPEFLAAAKEHEETLKFVEQEFEPNHSHKSSTRRTQARKSKPKSMADIYEKAAFGDNPSGTEH